MTCIVGVVKEGTIFMGGDSAGVAGLDIRCRKDEKVFKVQDKFLIGYTSSFRMGQILRYYLEVPKQTAKETDHEYMCTKFISNVRKILKDGGFLSNKNGEEEAGTFLVGYNKRLYEIGSDLQVGEAVDFYDSVGCGSKYALGALYASDSKASGKELVLSALQAATYFSGGVCAPYTFLKI